MSVGWLRPRNGGGVATSVSGPVTSRTIAAPDASRRPLLLTADSVLRDEVQRIAAAVGVELEGRRAIAEAHGGWSRASLVMVGSDAAVDLAAASLPRRHGVVLVAKDTDYDAGPDARTAVRDAELWRCAVAIGAEQVTFLSDGDAQLADRLADCAEERGGRGAVVCVVGGRGGAGATTFAVSVACRAAERGAAAMLIDADPLGGGVDLAVGCEGVAGTRWPSLAGARGRIDAGALMAALPRIGALSVLAFDRASSPDIGPDAMQAVLSAAQRACDIVVVDLPRAVSLASAEALGSAARTFLVVPAEVRATASAARVCAAIQPYASSVEAVVRGPGPSGLTAEVVADALGIPLAGALRPEPGITRALDCGDIPGRARRSPLRKMADYMLDDLVMSAVAA